MTRLHALSSQFVVGIHSAREKAHRQEGQALIEYALIISLIALVGIMALQTTGTNLHSMLNKIAGDA